MVVPRLTGVVDRRLLVNYRLDAAVARSWVPAPLRPQLVNGSAVAGICLLRLTDLRPTGLPAAVGVRSENVAHRIAVEWDDETGRRTGVYIPRRDSGSRLNVFAGGRLFPGPHGPAEFDVEESPQRLRVAFQTEGGAGASAEVVVRVTDELRGSALFANVSDASEFFRGGSVGWSPNRAHTVLNGIELRTDAWQVEPTEIESVRSSFYEGGGVPAGSADIDCVLLMRRVPVTWVDAGRITPELAAQPA